MIRASTVAELCEQAGLPERDVEVITIYPSRAVFTCFKRDEDDKFYLEDTKTGERVPAGTLRTYHLEGDELVPDVDARVARRVVEVDVRRGV